jgi:glycosyltransferase involved in cell wall biosynthesis
VAISAEIRDELIRSGMAADRIVSLTNAVDLARFAPAERINIDKPVVLYAGRLVARKGVDVLLQAWPSVLKQYPQAQLWIAGKGGNEPDSVEESLKTQAAPIPSVRFLGTVTRIEEVLRHADVFVFPSRREGQPGALLEAMASGLPCVATKIGGVVDTIDHNRNGWLVSPDNPTELADGISNLLKDQSLASRLGATAHETVMQRYAIDTIGGQYVQLYQRLNTKEELKA